MALQPASGARDLLPRDVGVNRWIAEQLSAVYRRWGYEEVTPPSLERIDTPRPVAPSNRTRWCKWWPMRPWACAPR